jgi:acetyl esterase/lipase
MKLSSAGLIGAALAISAGLSGCGEDEAAVVARQPTPAAATADAAAKTAVSAAKPDVKATAAATSTSAGASRAPKAAAATLAAASSVASSTSGAAKATTSDASKATTTAASTNATSGSIADGYDSGGYGGGYGMGMGGIAQPVITAPTTSAGSTNVKSTLLAKAQTLSTHLLLTGQTFNTRDGKQQTFDAYFPTDYATRTSGPYAFVVHGGDWNDGAKEDVRLYAIALAQKGIVAIAPNYRLAPTSIHPAQVNDLADVMAYISTTPSALFTTGTSYGAVGVAVGGQLVSLVALGPNASGQLKCVSAVFAPTDLTSLPSMDAAVKAYLGATYSPGAVMAVSPVYQISARAGTPSFYLSHGTADNRVPLAQSEAFAAELKRSGLSATLKVVEGAGHAYTEEQARTAATEIATFTASCLGI